MNKNIINWFRINNWKELKFDYQIVEVTIDGSDNAKTFNKAFNNAIDFLRFETKGPVASTLHEGKKCIAVSANVALKQHTIPGAPLSVILTPVNGTQTLSAKDIDESKLDLAVRFLESSIKFQLSKNSDLWDGGGKSFLKKIPLRQSQDIETDIYYGFKFRVVPEDKDNVFLCVDLAYRYLEKQSLFELLKNLPKERHADFVKGRNFLYQNGNDWYTVKGRSIGKSIEATQMPDSNISVYEYIKTQGKYSKASNKQPLIKESETFYHSYKNNSEKIFSGAACLAKGIRYAEDDLHKNSINDPSKRFMRAEVHVKNYFQGLKFKGLDLFINLKPYQKECGTFLIPSLKFGKDKILNPYEGHVDYGKPIDHFPKRRREFIYKNGLLSETPFTPQYLFIPDNLPFALGRSIKYYFDKILKLLSPNFPGLTIHQYPMRSAPYAHKVYEDLKKYIDEKQMGGSCAIFILPESNDNGLFNKYLHNIIKKELFNNVRIKCISAKKIQRYLKQGVDKYNNPTYFIPDGAMAGFKSYQANTIFEYLILNRKWPYVLADKLNYDLYIGIDAHEFYAGFVFFFKNGEKIIFDTEKVAKPIGSFRNEKINHKVIEEKIVSVLTRHLKVGEDVPKSIVIMRDGVSYGEEERALIGALKQLGDAQLLNPAEITTGVIDIAKSSVIPVRAAKFVDTSTSLENPISGTYFYMNKKSAFIFNTGAPYRVSGSSNPIHVSHSSGDIDFQKALEDVFRLTQITFSSPDRPTSLPLPLKLIDTLIRDVAHEFDYATTQQKEVVSK